MRPKNEIMNPDEMLEVESRGSRLYSQTSDHGAVVSEIVSNLAEELAKMPRRIDLRDTQLIGQIAVAYVDACSKRGTLPTKIGMCRAMGVTRQGVDWFLNHHAEEPSADLLNMIFDSFAEALNTASLASAVHPIVSIFLSKAIYNYRDTVSIEAAPAKDPLGDHVSADVIAKKYQELSDFLPD